MTKKHKAILVVSIFLFLSFFVLMALVLLNKTQNLDETINKFFFELNNENLYNFLRVFTKLGWFWVLLAICILYLIVSKVSKESVLLLSNFLISGIVSTIVKYSVQRTRPVFHLVEEIGYSFPSAHAMLSLAVFGFLSYLLWKRCKNKLVNLLISIFFALFVLGITFSRIYLGAHYFTDCLAGLILGALVLMINIWLFDYLYDLILGKLKSKQKKK